MTNLSAVQVILLLNNRRSAAIKQTLMSCKLAL